MKPKDYLIQCVRDLCAIHGADEVAEKAGISAEGLKQVVAGTKLPNGDPRGVGAKVQGKLDAAYPGWSTLFADPKAREVAKVYTEAKSAAVRDWLYAQAKIAARPDAEELLGLRRKAAEAAPLVETNTSLRA